MHKYLKLRCILCGSPRVLEERTCHRHSLAAHAHLPRTRSHSWMFPGVALRLTGTYPAVSWEGAPTGTVRVIGQPWACHQT